LVVPVWVRVRARLSLAFGGYGCGKGEGRMGWWMEIHRERITPDENGTYQPLVMGETAPHPLMYAARCLGRVNCARFPLLNMIRFDSEAYIDETIWLDADAATRLLDEVQRLQRVCRREEFISGLDGTRFAECWRDGESSDDFELRVDSIEALLTLAASNNYWVLLLL